MDLNIFVGAEVARNNRNVVDRRRWIEVVPLLGGGLLIHLLALARDSHWSVGIYGLILIEVDVVLTRIEVLMARRWFMGAASLLAADVSLVH